MAKNDRDLFNRLRGVGLRKQVAKTLSGIGEDAGKKAINAARSAVSELRSLADDIESRLPSLPGAAPRAGSARSRGRSASGSNAAKPSARTSSARTSRTPRTPRTPSASRSTARRSTARRSTTARRSSSGAGSRAPRGANKAKILTALSAGPKTASEIAKETGIGVGTVGSTLTKMAGSGEVQKAARGYALPS